MELNAMSVNNRILRRYTTLPALLHVLRSRTVTLLSPEKWEDRNDAYYMQQYKERLNARSVLALCFSMAKERYHFWRAFTLGTDGVRIDFQRDSLLASFNGVENVEQRRVTYKQIKDLSKLKPKIPDLPFLKRAPFTDENEFRLVYVDYDQECEAKAFDIDLSCIRTVTMNPWMPRPLLESVRETIQSIEGCRRLRVSHTTSQTYLKFQDWPI
jgi:hypothetical protein